MEGSSQNTPEEHYDRFQEALNVGKKMRSEAGNDESANIPEELFEHSEDTQAEIEPSQVERASELLGEKEVTKIREIVGALHEPIKKMLEPVLENIKNSDYQLLIGDDASGRIPTLIVRKFINDAYKHASQPSIPTRFIAGAKADSSTRRKDSIDEERTTPYSFHQHEERELLKEEKKEKVKAYITNLKDVSTVSISNALVVTELIESGNSLLPLTKALQENDITSTILTVQIYNPSIENKLRLEKKLGVSSVFYGEDYQGSHVSMYNRKQLTGVYKHFADLHATPVRGNLVGYEYQDDKKREILAKMTIARDEANHVAEQLIAELLTPERSKVI